MTRVIACVLVAAGCWATLAAVIPPPRPVDVADLVHRLGNPEFADREAAGRRLATLPVAEVPPELLAALKSDNPEVRNRAAKAVKALREYIAQGPERAAIARLPRGERFAKRGQIDLYVASTSTSQWNSDDDRMWVPAFEAGTRAVAKAQMTGDRRQGRGEGGRRHHRRQRDEAGVGRGAAAAVARRPGRRRCHRHRPPRRQDRDPHRGAARLIGSQLTTMTTRKPMVSDPESKA